MITNEIIEKNWREQTLHEALLVAATENCNPENTIVARVRQHAGTVATMIAYLNRDRILEWLSERAQWQRSLSPATVDHLGYNSQKEWSPYLGWHSAGWKGSEIEIVFTPGGGPCSASVFIGADRALLSDAVEDLVQFSMRPKQRCLRYSNGWEAAPDLDAEIDRIHWDDVVLPDATMSAIRSAVEDFAISRERFHALGFSWRRGILLVGPPGTGKTMVCRAAASSCALPFLYVRDIAGHDAGRSIKAIFERARALSPCLLVFEDMDGFVTAANRTIFLNEMDGMQNNDGILILASSNHPERIDEALLKRPSRFDRVFHIGMPGIAERREYCRRIIARSNLHAFLAENVDRDALVEQIARRTEGFTPAYLKEVFVSAALACVHDGHPKLDQAFADAALRQVDELRDFLRKANNPEALGELNSGATIGLRN